MKKASSLANVGLASTFIVCAFLSLSVHYLLTLVFVVLSSYFMKEL
ncbi:hypothetical protein [Gracilibacillus thailandensis]|uniref:Uncharacterized protein n=1 Tax=Gracilibacillus thailandensis TaxID=563735 RepID=A0A6N7QUB1_9BACI|nr:hypothetical protein [Gracilibacillus thailandensis]MRI65124.1 hypothetical protein [Gracilibacillus thailandensis]